MKTKSTIEKTKSAPTLPISAKAYTKFTTRIKEVFASEKLMCNQMLAALDLYMQGDPDYAEGLTLRARQALAFLLYDVDEAMTRSAKARARRKKTAKEESENGEEVCQKETKGRRPFNLVNRGRLSPVVRHDTLYPVPEGLH